MSNQELAEGLYKPIIRKFEKRKVHSSFPGNIWGADLTNMQFISKFNEVTRLLLCFVDIFSKYTWIIFLKVIKKVLRLPKKSQNLIVSKESNRKPNKIWVDKGTTFYNISLKSWFQYNDIELYSAHNVGKLLLLKDLLEP